MGIRKLNPFRQLRPPEKELSFFWKSFFEKLTISLSKHMTEIVREHVRVELAHRETVPFSDYHEEISERHFLQFFKISPHGSMGFYSLPDEFGNFLIHHILGGVKNIDIIRERSVGEFDRQVISIVSHKLIKMLVTPFIQSNRNIAFELLDFDQNDFHLLNFDEKVYLSVQRYVVIANGESFHFDLVFQNRFLGQFSLVG